MERFIKRFTGEPNRMEELRAQGLVVEGAYKDVRDIVVMDKTGRRTVHVTPVVISGVETVTIFRPNKAELRRMADGQ